MPRGVCRCGVVRAGLYRMRTVKLTLPEAPGDRLPVSCHPT
jgi:hypothetical protein